MLNAQAFAHSATTVSLAGYVGCRVLSLIAPDFLFGIGRSWFHTFSMDSLKGVVPLDIGTFVFGGLVLAVLVWVATYATITLYNNWSK